MKNRKHFIGGFIACLHCLLMALPLGVLCVNIIKNAIHYQSSYETTYVYDENGNYQESSREYGIADYYLMAVNETLVDFNVFTIDTVFDDVYAYNSWDSFYENEYQSFPFLLNVNYLGLFELNTSSGATGYSLSTYAYINFYLNWLINMSILVFVPELIVCFIDICRKLIYSFSHKIDGGF